MFHTDLDQWSLLHIFASIQNLVTKWKLKRKKQGKEENKRKKEFSHSIKKKESDSKNFLTPPIYPRVS